MKWNYDNYRPNSTQHLQKSAKHHLMDVTRDELQAPRPTRTPMRAVEQIKSGELAK